MKQYTYIKRSISSIYVAFNEPLKAEEYNNLGETWQDYLDNKWVLLSAEQIAFKNDNPLATVEEVWNMTISPEPVIPERTIADAKEQMINNIKSYDNSLAVNGFYANGEEYWFTAEERSNFKSSIDAAKLVGMERITFYLGNQQITIGILEAEQMLAQLQLYADRCFIVTKQHIISVEEITNIEDIDNFDYMNGYPMKLTFDFQEGSL